MVRWINNKLQQQWQTLNLLDDDTAYEKYKVKLGFIHTYHVKSTFNATTQLESNFILYHCVGT